MADIKKQSRANWLNYVGPCLSLLCLMHCIGTAIVVLLAPSLLQHIPHNGAMEALVVLIIIVLGFISINRLKASNLLRFLFIISSGFCTGSLISHWDHGIHMGIVAMALIQVPLILCHSLSRKKPPCCT